MTVSVIIPTVLRSPTVTRCVRAAADSAARFHPDAEVLLVVNGPAAAAPLPPVDPRVRVVRSAAACVSAARNEGVRLARHDAVLFTDDDLVVPPRWCAEMARPLLGGGHAVAAPVRTVVTGPVTAFLHHERVFDAAPLTADTAHALVTANAGYRRDLIAGEPFDVARYPHFAEDTDLGLRIRQAGGVIHWLGAAPAPLHEVDEEPASLVRRALRQGIGTAQVFLQRRDLQYYYPSPVAAYRRCVDTSAPIARRYLEVDDPGARTVFAALGMIRRAVLLAGYLSGIGAAHDVALVQLDEDALTAGITTVFEELLAIVPAVRWDAVPVRFRPAPADAAPVDPALAATAAGLAKVLSRAAPPVPTAAAPPAASQDDLTWLARDAVVRDRVSRAGTSGTEPDEREVERAARAGGVAFGRACEIRETHRAHATRRWPGAGVPMARAAGPARGVA
ncbi:hypothetical protein GCM10020358_40520 [Amorphoplanes nipponensis]|uniref:Glycosyltransferase 2-like domain-containing protein n=1 Tax=Actinoplanes nipponensis TaxID=135950 RepID=A0A919JD28_9ACTN|nr:glycosyltransferase family 2 protein [Actinoplanes nipponensis]GIE47357.1 hypothetical protein Ani05nite_08910 [Actinoplanes nipponensis]